jgi:hypothetical protein
MRWTIWMGLMKFPLGQTVVTAAAHAFLTPEETLDCIRRHSNGDWGEVGLDDTALNNDALLGEDPGRIHSAYVVRGRRIWVITEWDRSVTTVLFPEDY